jgi:spore maturation protein CgeB
MVLSNSIKAVKDLEDMGAKKVDTLYYAADPNIFRPIEATKIWGICYYGHRNVGKEARFDYMVKEPSINLKEVTRFMIAGQDSSRQTKEYQKHLGEAIPWYKKLSLSQWCTLASKSWINLNITKDSDATAYGTSSARPFELAAMGCCIVSDKYEGIREWFGEEEVIVTENSEEATEIYAYLLRKPLACISRGQKARGRVFAEHTYHDRAKKLVNLVKEL